MVGPRTRARTACQNHPVELCRRSPREIAANFANGNGFAPRSAKEQVKSRMNAAGIFLEEHAPMDRREPQAPTPLPPRPRSLWTRLTLVWICTGHTETAMSVMERVVDVARWIGHAG